MSAGQFVQRDAHVWSNPTLYTETRKHWKIQIERLYTQSCRHSHSINVYCTSFQISRGSYILEVVHVDDINYRGNHSGLILEEER